MTLDLRGEERPLVLCMLEYLYVNEYTFLTKGDAEDLQWLAAAYVHADFHNQMYLLRRYGLLRL